MTAPRGALVLGPRDGVFLSWRGERGQHLAIGETARDTFTRLRGTVMSGFGPPPPEPASIERLLAAAPRYGEEIFAAAP